MKKRVTGDGKKPKPTLLPRGEASGERAKPNGPKLVHSEDPLPAPLKPLDDPKRPAAVISPHGFVANRRVYVPPEPNHETLMRADHGQWVEQFSQYMSLDTGVPHTAFRQGAITRLHWAARYIAFIEQRNKALQEQIFKLTSGTTCPDPNLGSATSGSASGTSSIPSSQSPEEKP